MSIKISSFKHLRLRAFVLVIIAIPALTCYPFSLWTGDKIKVITAWLDYAIIVNILIIYEVGFQQWQFFFAFASIVSMFIILCGALLSFIFNPEIYNNFENAVKGLLGYDSLKQMCIMLCVIPWALFASRSFPPYEIFDRLLKRKKKPSLWTKGLIFVCRMLTHVTEIVVDSFYIWREEMPALIKPRYTLDHGHNPIIFVKNRFINSIEACCRLLLIRTFEPIPTFWEEIKAFGEIKHRD